MVLNQSIKITEDTKKKLDERKAQRHHPRATYDEVINEAIKISGKTIQKLEGGK